LAILTKTYNIIHKATKFTGAVDFYYTYYGMSNKSFLATFATCI